MLLLDLLRTRNPGLPLPRILAYESCWYPIRAFFTCLYHMQVEGREHVPRRGGVLVVANHQTNFDPPLMAVGCRRHFHFVAKLPLFRHPLAGAIIRYYNAIPIEQGKPDTAAIKASIEHLRAGRVVLIYAEGNRTHDGAMNRFKPGMALLIRRARVPVVPLAIEGAFDAWPRRRPRPKITGHIRIRFGEAIAPADLIAAGPQGMLQMLERRIDDMRLDLRRKIRAATRGRLPRPGPGDYRFDDPILQTLRTPDPDP